MTKNSEVDAFIDRATQWKAETKALRSVLLNCGLGEELKWRKPCYTFQGGNVAIIQGFKEHCSLMFFKGSLLQDTDGHLVRQGKNSQAAMRIQFTSVKQVEKLESVLRALIDQAMEVEGAGLKIDFQEKRELKLPEELSSKLNKDPDLAAAFNSLTPGRQRAYVLHFSGAKQSKTRVARIEKCMERILDGKGLNDR